MSTQLDRHTYGKFKPGLPSTLPVAGEKVQAPTDQAKATNATVAVVAKHTITIKTPVPVTHAEIVAVVRGGALSRVFVKRQENQVDVSFVRAADASAFLQWTRTFPLIVAGKRVSTSIYEPLPFYSIVFNIPSLHLPLYI